MTVPDPQIDELRRQISAVDQGILDAVNTRLELVARIKQAKAARGLDFVDRGREEQILAMLGEANRGPLTSDGLRELFEKILDLTKREVAKLEDGAP